MKSLSRSEGGGVCLESSRDAMQSPVKLQELDYDGILLVKSEHSGIPDLPAFDDHARLQEFVQDLVQCGSGYHGAFRDVAL